MSYSPAASNRVYPWVTDFRNAHLPDALKLAAVIGHGVTADEVLAASGAEIDYGRDAKAKVHGNFFGIHSRGTDPENYFPGQVGAMPTKRDGPMATFRAGDGFMVSGLIFANRMKAVAEGQDLSHPDNFFALAHAHGWGVTKPDYLPFVRGVYDLLRNSARSSERRA